MDKICIFCKEFYFSTGEGAYSEYTPGHDASILCLEGHWKVDLYGDTTESYREKLLMAQTCQDFTLVDDVSYPEGN